MVELQFTGQINTSLQAGDIVYYLQTSQVAGFDTSSTSPIEIGPVSEILVSNFNEYTIRINTSSAVPTGNNYYLFSKDNTVNLASVLGYHAEVQFVNNSDKKSEMFSIGSMIQLNSK